MIPPQVVDLVRLALVEDLGPGDLTTSLTIDPTTQVEARIFAKQDLILSGLIPAGLVFELVDPTVSFQPQARDGEFIAKGRTVIDLRGPAASILIAERVALNFLMHLSGIASYTGRFVEAIKGFKARIIDTRKTTPGHRTLEKAAVRHGGGHNHRFGLHDGILIKDNHIAAAGSITKAVALAKLEAPHTLKIEIEVEDLPGLEEAIQAGADTVLLDNMTSDQLTAAVQLAAGRVRLEASGGVNLANVAQIAAAGVDLISIGALTHSAPAVDLSLKISTSMMGR